MNKIMMGFAAAAAALFATGASAAMISASDIASGSASGITFTATGGSLGLKTKQGVTGVGVTGGSSGNEIDINPGQAITASSSGFILNALTLAFLYDGPEFGDVQEVAQIQATLAGGGMSTATVTNGYTSANDTDVTLDVDGSNADSLITNATMATDSVPSEITLGALFGNSVLTSLEFTAQTGACGTGPCNNQSDYSIESLDARNVPEPSELALAALALALIGFGIGRRWTQA